MLLVNQEAFNAKTSIAWHKKQLKANIPAISATLTLSTISMQRKILLGPQK